MVQATTAVIAWSAGGAQAAGAWRIIAAGGATCLVALLLWIVLRAVVRRRHYRVDAAFGETDRAAVRKAVAAAERRTVGEILPVVVERSDAHRGAEWLAALAFSLVGTLLLFLVLPWDLPLLVVAVQVALGALGFALARRLSGVKRVFMFEHRATEVAEEQAFQEFYRHGLHETESATGVLVFVSLLEQRVVVLADKGIDAEVDAAFWVGVDEVVLAGIRAGSLRDGLVAGVNRVGDLLAERFPWREGDRNEIPDRLIVRRDADR